MTLEVNSTDYLRSNNIQQKKLAQKIGMREDTLCLTLSGKRKMLAEEYVKICDALCVPYEKFSEES